MTERQNRRRMPRIPLPGRPTARTRGAGAVRLVDLSLNGAHLEHLNVLRPGYGCTLELPAALGSLVLAAQIMWSQVVGTENSPEGRLLRCQSGLMFPRVTPEQRNVLARALDERGLSLEATLDLPIEQARSRRPPARVGEPIASWRDGG